MTSSIDKGGGWVVAGTVGRPHGLDGCFHVIAGKPRLLVTGSTLHIGGERGGDIRGERGGDIGVGRGGGIGGERGGDIGVERGGERGGPLHVDGDIWVERSYVVRKRLGTDQAPIIGLQDVESRERALRIRGRDLLVATKDAPSLPAGEWWAHELEGCVVYDGELEVGLVDKLIELPSCEVLEVRKRAGGDLLVPMVRDAIRNVDVAARRIEVDLSFLGEAR